MKRQLAIFVCTVALVISYAGVGQAAPINIVSLEYIHPTSMNVCEDTIPGQPPASADGVRAGRPASTTRLKLDCTTPVPEPASMVLLLTGLSAAPFVRKRISRRR